MLRSGNEQTSEQSEKLPPNFGRPWGLFTAASLALLLAALAYPMVLYRQGLVGFRVVPIQIWYAAILGYGGVMIGLSAIVFYLREQRKTAAAERRVQQTQERTLKALRAQRHDVLNELTLASSYLDVGRTQEARQVIAFLAMTLSERFDSESLPADAWLTIIRNKQQEAAQRGITLVAEISGPGPADPTRQRYLPRIIGNLLDNAFDAALQDESPFVRLAWDASETSCSLAVTNNGPGIAPEARDQVFDMGFSTKGGEHRGWGLVLCKKMARRIRGELKFSSDDGLTTFHLHLPADHNEDLQKWGHTG